MSKFAALVEFKIMIGQAFRHEGEYKQQDRTTHLRLFAVAAKNENDVDSRIVFGRVLPNSVGQ